MRILILLLLVSISTLFPCSGAHAQQKLLVITDAWPPYVYEENDRVVGFDYEVMISVLGDMGYEVDFMILPWKRCVLMIEMQQADAILDISKNEKRLEFMHFPQEKLSDSSSVLFHRKDRSFTFNSLEDLSGLIVGTILGYSYNKEFLEADFFTRAEVSTEEQNFGKLMRGHIDLMLTNKNVGLFTAKRMGLLDAITYLPNPLSGGENYLAFSKKPGHEQLAAEFSDRLREFKKSEEFKSILRKYGQ